MLKLVATPLSHYSRKCRILLDLYNLPHEIIGVKGNIAAFAKNPQDLGDNPMMRVPVLIHGDDWIIESDHIASYIVSLCDKDDKYKVNSKNIFDLNVKAMLNNIMEEEVKIITGTRLGIQVKQYEYFNKSDQRVNLGLQWLEDRHEKFNTMQPAYKEFHLICLWDHLAHVDFVPNLRSKFPHLNEIAASVSESLPVIKRTAPGVLAQLMK